MFPNLSSLVRSLIKESTFLLALVLLGLAAACGATETPEPFQTVTPGTGGSATEAPSIPSSAALQLLQSSWDNIHLPESFRFTLEMTITEADQVTALALQMEAAKDGITRMVMDSEVLGRPFTSEVITTQEKLFINLQTLGWLRRSFESMASLSGESIGSFGDPMAQFNNLLQQSDTDWEKFNIISLGQEEIDGIPTEHLKKEPNDLGVSAESNQGDLEQLSAIFGLDPSFQSDLSKPESSTSEVWLDSEGYPRRMRSTTLAASTSVRLDVRMTDVNEDILINLPTEFTEFPEAC